MSVLHRPASLLGSAAFAGLLVAGLGACSDDETSVFDVSVGDCMDSEATGEVSEVPVVPCDEPHNGEIYHTYDVPGDEFPGDFTQVTEEQCLPAFQEFVGLPYEQSELVFTTLEPSSESWDDGDRELVCIISDPAGNTTGSLEGANR